jgi:hypothetical protein
MTLYKKYLAGAAVAVTLLIGSYSPSHAATSGDYCREYTRTVYIGNQRQEAYGTACLRPDGQWEIVSEGNQIPATYLPPVTQTRTVYVREPAQVVYYNRRPASVFFFGTPFRHNRYYNNVRYNRYDRHDRYDHHDNGRGRGHGHR